MHVSLCRVAAVPEPPETAAETAKEAEVEAEAEAWSGVKATVRGGAVGGYEGDARYVGDSAACWFRVEGSGVRVYVEEQRQMTCGDVPMGLRGDGPRSGSK